MDAAYNSLVTVRRQQFHRRIAEVLESRFPDIVGAQPELVAHHFAQAGLVPEAAAYWLKAGLRSRERSADHEAIGQLTTAVSLLETLEETEARNDLELRVLSALAPAYIAVRGYAAPEAGPIRSGPGTVRTGRALDAHVRDPVGDVGVAPGTGRNTDLHRSRQ